MLRNVVRLFLVVFYPSSFDSYFTWCTIDPSTLHSSSLLYYLKLYSSKSCLLCSTLFCYTLFCSTNMSYILISLSVWRSIHPTRKRKQLATLTNSRISNQITPHTLIHAHDSEASADIPRSLELAAYFTHCNLQPSHLMLALKTAMALAFKSKVHRLEPFSCPVVFLYTWVLMSFSILHTICLSVPASMNILCQHDHCFHQLKSQHFMQLSHQNYINAAGFSRRLLELPDMNSERNAESRSKVRNF